MINTCSQCGTYRPDKQIDPAGPFAICPECGYRQGFRQLPLLVVCGASGTGKSAVCQALTGLDPQSILLEADILWRKEFATPEDHYRGFFETWLRVCKNVAQSGRPVVLFCAGGIPANLEPCVERRYFTQVHYLALTCQEQELTRRLQARPAWRNSGQPEFIQEQVQFNQWLIEIGQHGTPKIALVDTSDKPVEETQAAVLAWIQAT